jgi:hypothetical protein
LRQMNHVSPHLLRRTKMRIWVFCDATQCFGLSGVKWCRGT